MIDPGLRKKYLATTYLAELPEGPLPIRIGAPTPALATDWAFVSAESPGSSPDVTPEENQRRTDQLASELAARRLRFYPGRGVPDEPGWTAENSFLVLGISREEAVSLGRDFGQNAVVAGRPGEPAQLVDCR